MLCQYRVRRLADLRWQRNGKWYCRNLGCRRTNEQTSPSHALDVICRLLALPLPICSGRHPSPLSVESRNDCFTNLRLVNRTERTLERAGNQSPASALEAARCTPFHDSSGHSWHLTNTRTACTRLSEAWRGIAALRRCAYIAAAHALTKLGAIQTTPEPSSTCTC